MGDRNGVLRPNFATSQTLWNARSDSDAVTWISPSPGDSFVPGDTIVGAWNATLDITSPSFRLCYDGTQPSANGTTQNMSCGQSVVPHVDQDGETFSVNLSVPNMTHNGNFLQMETDQGSLYQSPLFYLSANGDPEPSTLASSPSMPSTGSSVVSSTSTPMLSASPLSDIHTEAPTAALAVPLSLCGALVLASVLTFVARKKLGGKPDNPKTVAVSNLPSNKFSFASHVDLEKRMDPTDRFTPLPPCATRSARFRRYRDYDWEDRKAWEEDLEWQDWQARRSRSRRYDSYRGGDTGPRWYEEKDRWEHPQGRNRYHSLERDPHPHPYSHHQSPDMPQHYIIPPTPPRGTREHPTASVAERYLYATPGPSPSPSFTSEMPIARPAPAASSDHHRIIDETRQFPSRNEHDKRLPQVPDLYSAVDRAVRR